MRRIVVLWPPAESTAAPDSHIRISRHQFTSALRYFAKLVCAPRVAILMAARSPQSEMMSGLIPRLEIEK